MVAVLVLTSLIGTFITDMVQLPSSNIMNAVLGIASMRSISLLSVDLWTNRSTALSLAYLVLSLSVNIALTVAIVSRLLYFRHRLPKVIGDASIRRIYVSIVAMFVESASLYTAVAVACIITCVVHSPARNALLPMLGQLQVRSLLYMM